MTILSVIFLEYCDFYLHIQKFYICSLARLLLKQYEIITLTMYKFKSVKTEIFDIIKVLLADKSQVVVEDTQLIGGDKILDSMQLVELCLELEDKAEKIGFEFDWTSDVAMSRSRSMFRTAGSLADEFVSQMEAKK